MISTTVHTISNLPSNTVPLFSSPKFSWTFYSSKQFFQWAQNILQIKRKYKPIRKEIQYMNAVEALTMKKHLFKLSSKRDHRHYGP